MALVGALETQLAASRATASRWFKRATSRQRSGKAAGAIIHAFGPIRGASEACAVADKIGEVKAMAWMGQGRNISRTLPR